MIKLSDRLMLIASQIENNETMADVGTDHGFLPMYLADAGICPKVILADISKGSLEKGRVNAEGLIAERAAAGNPFPEGTFEYRLGSGIEVIENGEVDAVVIAGMGGQLIAEIMEHDLEKAKSLKKFILQPRNGQGKLRYSLLKNGFKIEKNLLVKEGKFICDVIVATYDEESEEARNATELAAGAMDGANGETADGGPGKSQTGLQPDSDDDIKYEFPAELLENGDIAVEYIKRRIGMEQEILDSIVQSGVDTEETRTKQEFFRKRIEYLKNLV